MSKKKLSSKDLIKKGVPYILIPGLLLAIALGFKGVSFKGIRDYYELKQLFPSSGYVQTIEDGDTFTLKSGVKIRLVGIDSPDRGQKGFSEAADELSNQVTNKRVYLEYDRYQDDKFGRVLAWVWVDCEQTPKFLPADYMHKSGNESNVGLTQNPDGCKKGKLINAELVKEGLAKAIVYKDRGELKYQKLLENIK